MQKNIIYPAKILLPKDGLNYERLSVIACDQFTSQPEYWKAVKEHVGECPSTLNIILPEAFLEKRGVKKRIENIQAAMREYRQTVLTKSIYGFAYTERTMKSGKIRCGLVAAVDLEDYSYEKGDKPLIRPSENTVVSRIPPRLEVRRGACLESPHIMMLIDDDKKEIIESVARRKESLQKLYDFDLMQGGGRLCGYAVTGQEQIEEIQKMFAEIASSGSFDKKYPQAAGTAPIAMAVGDGNHSLATAKAYWEELKKGLSEQERENHPARYCLVEIVNIHSEAIEIEPIHRVFFGLSDKKLYAEAERFFSENGSKPVKNGGYKFVVCAGGKETVLRVRKNKKWALPTAAIEAFAEYITEKYSKVRVDYIHGEDTVRELCGKEAAGVILPPLEKGDLFKGVVLGGVLPRKTFSMGHAEEKRYYMECKDI